MKKYLVMILVAFIYSQFVYSQCAFTAIQFDGVNDYVETNSAGLTTSPNGTLEAWVNITALGGDQAIISRGKTVNTIGIWLVVRNNGRVDLDQNDNSSIWHSASSTTLLTVGQWYHIAACWGSEGMKLYVNGVLEGSNLFTGVGTPASFTTVFGDWKEQTSGAFSFKGKIDEVRIWNTALSQADINQWKSKALTSLHPIYANLAGYWKFDEGNGAIAYNSAPSSPDGILTNAPVWVSSGAVIDCNTATWTGTTNSDWHAASNWSGGVVPGSNYDINIPAGAPNQPVISLATAYFHDITIDNGATLTHNNNTNPIFPSGNWANNGTFNAGTGTVYFLGKHNTQIISGNTTFYNLTINRIGSGSATKGAGSIAVTNLFRIQTGTFTGSGTFKNIQNDAGTFFHGDGGQININGNWTNSSFGFTHNFSPVVFTGTANQTASGNFTFNTLTINNIGIAGNNTVTFSNSWVETKNLNLFSGKFKVPVGFTLFMTNGATITSDGGDFAAPATNDGIQFYGSATMITITPLNFYQIVRTNGTTDFGSNSTINWYLQLNNGTNIINNAPFYATNSFLRYCMAGTTYTRGLEWSATSGKGYPFHVQFGCSPGTTLMMGSTPAQCAGSLTVTWPSVLNMGSNTNPLVALGGLTIEGTLILSTMPGGDIKVGGNWFRRSTPSPYTGIFTPNNRSVHFIGSGTQTISHSGGAETIPNVVINKSSGTVTLLNDLNIPNSLIFSSGNNGIIATSTNKLVVSNNNSTAIDRQGNGHISGNLQRAIAAGSNTYLFPVGDATAYRPVVIDLNGVPSGNLLAKVSQTAGDHPNIGSSILNAAKSVNRFWTLTDVNNTLTSGTYDATFEFVAADKDAGANASNFNVGKYENSNWTYPASVAIDALHTKITGANDFSDFAIAELVCTAPVPNVANLPPVSGQCSVTVTAPTATSNCFGQITGTTTDPVTYNNQGTYTIHWTYDDGNGNTSSQTQTVIVQDHTAPVPNVANLPTVTEQCSATVTAPAATDNCAGTVTATTNDPLSYTAQGTYTVHWTYNDGNGNTSSQTQTVIINDNTPPSFDACPGSIILSACSGVANWTEPTATDNCPGVTVTRSGPAPGSVFALGISTTIVYTATDAAGNTAQCSFTVSRASALTVSASATAITCNGASSMITVSAAGGRAPYTGTGTFSRTAGTYSFTVTDADGCTASASVTINQPAPLTSTCTSNNNVLYYGFSGDQTALITVKPSGGVGPYTVSLSMNRPLKCNVITSSGDELWVPGANTASNYNTVCPSSGSASLPPVSTSTGVINSTAGYSVTVTLMQNAVITANITDANGCTTSCSININAEDVRCFSGNSGISKITICHQTGSSSKPCIKICVDETAVADHLGHGDFFGNCTPDCVAPANNLTRIDPNTEQTKAQLRGTWVVNIRPNPAKSYFTLRVQSISVEPVSIRVYDITGKLVYQNSGIKLAETYFGESLAPGIYMAEIIQGSQTLIKKIIKQ